MTALLSAQLDIYGGVAVVVLVAVLAVATSIREGRP